MNDFKVFMKLLWVRLKSCWRVLRDDAEQGEYPFCEPPKKKKYKRELWL